MVFLEEKATLLHGFCIHQNRKCYSEPPHEWRFQRAQPLKPYLIKAFMAQEVRGMQRALAHYQPRRETDASCSPDDLERFSNTYVLTDSIEGGFFLRKKPLCGVVSVYSNWRIAITAPRRVHRSQLDGRGGSAARPLDCRQDCPKNRTHCPFLGFASKFLQIFILCIILTMDQNSSNLCIFSKKQLFFALW